MRQFGTSIAKVSIDDLNDRVTHYPRTQARTAHGVLQYAWDTPAGEYWARVVGYSAKLAEQAAEMANVVTYRVVMRYREGIHAGDRLAYRERMLTVDCEPMLVGGRREFIYFDCRELVEHG